MHKITEHRDVNVTSGTEQQLPRRRHAGDLLSDISARRTVMPVLDDSRNERVKIFTWYLFEETINKIDKISNLICDDESGDSGCRWPLSRQCEIP